MSPSAKKQLSMWHLGSLNASVKHDSVFLNPDQLLRSALLSFFPLIRTCTTAQLQSNMLRWCACMLLRDP